jgi:hypothetical protein
MIECAWSFDFEVALDLLWNLDRGSGKEERRSTVKCPSLILV